MYLIYIRVSFKYISYIWLDLLFPAGPDILLHIGAGTALQGLITQVYRCKIMYYTLYRMDYQKTH